MMNGWGFMGMPVPQRFEEQYHCYSMACADKGHLEVRWLFGSIFSGLWFGVVRCFLW